MRNVNILIDTGREIVEQDKSLDISASELKALKNTRGEYSDVNMMYDMLFNAYYFGLARGYQSQEH